MANKGGFIGQDGLNAPDSPTGVSGSAGNTQVDVSFTAPSDVGGSAITGYRVQDSTGAHGASGSSSPITVTGLTNGTHTLTVYSNDTSGNTGTSETITFTIAKEAEPEPEPNPTSWTATVAAIAAVAVVGAATILVYRKTRKNRT